MMKQLGTTRNGLVHLPPREAGTSQEKMFVHKKEYYNIMVGGLEVITNCG